MGAYLSASRAAKPAKPDKKPATADNQPAMALPRAPLPRIQLASDIHLEQNPGMTMAGVLTPSADILVLAGDIGCPARPAYRQFLSDCAANFKHTILVAGNHEYRRCIPATMQQVDAALHRMAAEVSGPASSAHDATRAAAADTAKRGGGNGAAPNAVAAAAAEAAGSNGAAGGASSPRARPRGRVHYLAHGQNVVIDGINFIGGALFSLLTAEAFTPEQLESLDASLGEQNLDAKRPWSVELNNQAFKQTLRAIEQAVNWGAGLGLANVVVTHYAPLMEGPFHRSDLPKDYLYGTDLSYAMDGQYIQAWLYGHTHCNWTGNVKGTLVASNQYGACGVRRWKRAHAMEVPPPPDMAVNPASGAA